GPIQHEDLGGADPTADDARAQRASGPSAEHLAEMAKARTGEPRRAVGGEIVGLEEKKVHRRAGTSHSSTGPWLATRRNERAAGGSKRRHEAAMGAEAPAARCAEHPPQEVMMRLSSPALLLTLALAAPVLAETPSSTAKIIDAYAMAQTETVTATVTALN